MNFRRKLHILRISGLNEFVSSDGCIVCATKKISFSSLSEMAQDTFKQFYRVAW